MSEEKIFDALIENIENLRKKIQAAEAEIKALQEDKDSLIKAIRKQHNQNDKEKEELKQEYDTRIEQLRMEFAFREAEIQAEIEESIKQIEELRQVLANLLAPPLPVGKLVQIVGDGTVVILDNHRACYRVLVSESINAEDLEEGCEVEYNMNPQTGMPTSIFNIRKTKREEEIITVKEVCSDDFILAVCPNDMIKTVNVAKKLKGTIKVGEELFYDAAINFAVGKVPKKIVEKKVDLEKVVNKTYKDIGGLKEQVAKVRRIVEFSFTNPEVYESLGITPHKGILLLGPPGCGKTLIVQAVVGELKERGDNVLFIGISGPEVMGPYVGEPEQKIKLIFDSAQRYIQECKDNKQKAQVIIFFDEIEAIAQKRGEMHTGQMVEQRVVSQLLGCLDGLNSREVIVLAATNAPDLLDEALRRPGRFDLEIQIGLPNEEARLEIFKIHSRKMPLAKDVDLVYFSKITHGFTGADIEAVCREAAMMVMKEIDLDNPDFDQFVKNIKGRTIEVCQRHFSEAIIGITPSTMREFIFEKPKETWNDIGGLEEIKEVLMEVIKWDTEHPELLKKANYPGIKNILLYGLPGCGKTLIAKALANGCGINFIAINGPELISKWVGETEANIRRLFRKASLARPCIICFDEIEALIGVRGGVTGDSGVTDRATSQLQAMIDGVKSSPGIFIIGTTNRPDLMDPAVLRPGRFDLIMEVPPPNKEGRMKIFKIHTKNQPLAEDINFDELAEKTEKITRKQRLQNGSVVEYSFPITGAHIKLICKMATRKAIKEFISKCEKEGKQSEDCINEFKITMSHLVEATEEHWGRILSKTKKSDDEKETNKVVEIKEFTDDDIDDLLN